MGVTLRSSQARALQFAAAHRPNRNLTTRASAYFERWLRLGLNTPAKDQAGLTINFHPDRSDQVNVSVIDAILRSGRILNQFETASTNGFALSDKNGVRPRRESILFGGAYDGSPARDRPKYGAVNWFGNPRGGWPRFGSCHWLLAPSILDRCTVTVPGSHSANAWWGSNENLLDLVSDATVSGVTGPGWHRFHLIDGPVELQIHGEILLERDVTGLVLDPSFRGTQVESSTARVAETFGIAMYWTPALLSTAADWPLTSASQHARQRVLDAVSAGQAITAAWIGEEVWATAPGSSARDIANRACRYLWNQLLLSQAEKVRTA